MLLKDLCHAAGISYPVESGDMEICEICEDSREVKEGALFVCVRGLTTDGNEYVSQAIANGACCVLSDKMEKPETIGDVVFLHCENCRAALAFLYDAWYGFPSKKLKLVGVTGTNGKTSVSHMIRAILEAAMYRCGMIGTVGCDSAGKALSKGDARLSNMTTPDPKVLYRHLAAMVEDGVEYVVMEVSSHALALDKVLPLHFTAAVFTNLTPEHLDFHGTMQNYAQAKAKLFERATLTVCNADSPYSDLIQRHAAGRCIACSVKGNGAEFCAEEVELLGKSGVTYRLRSLRTRLSITCPIPGEFTVMNTMQAAVCALELGCSPATVKCALATIGTVKGRMERVKLGVGAGFTVLIDYAHTPDALEKLLVTARGIVGSRHRLILVFGCGGDRDKSKRAPMGRIASEKADTVIVTSDNSRSEESEKIIEEILSGIENGIRPIVIPSRKEAIEHAIYQAHDGDMVLLAGKGHEEYEITKEGRRHFCEREIAVRAYEERLRRKAEQEGRKTERER